MTAIYVAMADQLLIAHAKDGGWDTDTALHGLAPRCLALDPLRPERIYCGTHRGGLRTSDDGGASWLPGRQGTVQGDITAVAVSSTERSAEHAVVYAGTEPSALFRSEDGGSTWRELAGMRKLPSAPTWSFPPRPYTSHVRWIALDPREAGTVYICIEAGALVRSFDSGRTWVDRTSDGPWDTHTLLTHHLAPGRLYSAAGDGFMAPGRGFNESRDGGDTWERPDQGIERHYLWSIAVDPADPDTMVASAASSPYTAHNVPSGGTESASAASNPQTTNKAPYADSTIYRRASGEPWREVREGLPETNGTRSAVLAANPAEAGVFYAASNRGVFRSSDAGLTWERLTLPWPDGYAEQAVNALVAIG